MNVIEMSELEAQVNRLMHTIETLQLEIASLRQKMASHIKERTRLQHKNECAVKQIKQLIKNIKEEMA
jgi:uncharacterized protein (TIGR02449 family)